jgi:hypothetical protein
MERSTIFETGARFDEHQTRIDDAKARLVEAQLAKERDSTASTSSGLGSEGSLLAPAYYEETYDPNNPSADWSGFVPKPRGRHHFQETQNAMKVQFQPDNGFIMPAADAQTSDFKRPGKKVLRAESSDQNSHPNYGRGSQMRSTPNLLGGPVPLTGKYAYNRFETEARSANSVLETGVGGTGIDQLTDKGRGMYVRGKKDVEAMYEQDMRMGGYDARVGEYVRQTQNPYEIVKNGGMPLGVNDDPLNDGGGGAGGRGEESLIGFRHHNGGHMKSMTAGLGAEVARSLRRPEKKTGINSAPFATDGNLPTDPYMGPNGRSKDMFMENYKNGGAIIGFTGNRKR